MKKIISILLFACAGALAACDFLDVVPEGQATQEDIFKTSKEARKYLNTLYTYAPNIAAYRYMPDFCAGDDIITATNGQTRYFPYKSMLYNEENASQTYYGLWDATTSSPSGRTNYDMYKGIRYCYIMIDNIDAVPGISPSVADEFKGEAYFLIAYYHWVLLTHYGPVILVRGQLDMGLPEEQVYVARSPFDECVTFIAETYDRALEILCSMPREQYLSLLVRLLKAAGGKGNEKIALSAKDRDEMGETLVERANKELNAHYTLAGEAADIRAGLVLISKECDVNCSFETLLALSREKTERGAAKLLFAE